MINQTDSKQNKRRDGSGAISYKFPDEEQSFPSVCLNINGSGIIFTAEQSIETGKALEVTIERETALTEAMIAYVEVLQSIALADDMFEVRTEIKGIKEN